MLRSTVVLQIALVHVCHHSVAVCWLLLINGRLRAIRGAARPGEARVHDFVFFFPLQIAGAAVATGIDPAGAAVATVLGATTAGAGAAVAVAVFLSE